MKEGRYLSILKGSCFLSLFLLSALSWSNPNVVTGTKLADANWQTQVIEKLKRQEYSITEYDGKIQAPNRAHNFRAFFSVDGLQLQSREQQGQSLLQLQFAGISRGKVTNSKKLSQTAANIGFKDNRVELKHANHINEWYINSETGLEHGFDINQKPRGQGPLVLFVHVNNASAFGADDNLRINAADGVSQFHYKKLQVFDANNQALTASMRALNNNTIAIEINDSKAVYPLLIDPILTNSEDTLLVSNKSNAYFSIGLSKAGDVNNDGFDDIVIGAPQFSNPFSQEGAVFIYHGSANGISTSYTTKIELDQSWAKLGQSVAAAGDVNNDGFDDIIASAKLYDNDESNEGAAFVFLGSASGVNTSYQVMLETNQISAEVEQVSSAGDVNGDGYADVMMSSMLINGGLGAVFIYHGSASGVSATPATQTADGSASSTYGFSIASAGDVNNDGYDDIVIGERDHQGTLQRQGGAYIHYGSASGIDVTPALTLEGPTSHDLFGYSVASAGDVNNDGYDDVIIGARWSEQSGINYAGAAYVYHGSATGLPNTPSTTIYGTVASSYLGHDVDGLGDINGDGFGDVVISASNRAYVYIYYGGTNGLSTVPDHTMRNIGSAGWGFTLSAAGDVNNDGYNDLLIGSQEHDNGSGKEGAVFVYYGGISSVQQTDGAIIAGEQAEDQFGYSVARAGDVNGDGFGDVIVGAPNYDNGQADEGAAFIFHGTENGLSTGVAAYLEINQASAGFGWDVSYAGDVNGDGYGDVIVSANRFDNGHTDEGGAFVFHGSSNGINTTVISQLEINQTSAVFGERVAFAGDVNGDGFADVIVGSAFYDNGLSNEGGAFIYHGSSSGINTTIATQLEVNQAEARFGMRVSGAGDVNADGYGDVIVSADLYDSGQTDEGVAFVFHGSSTGVTTDIKSQLELNQASAQFGIALSEAGDVNGDGYADVIVGSHLYTNGQSNEGAAVVFHGSSTGVQTTPAITLEANQASAQFGVRLGEAGDINGDGYGDIAIAATNYDNGESNEGAVFIYLGGSSGISSSYDFLLEQNQASAEFGSGVESAGDINGDGYDDLIVGARYYDQGKTNQGAAFIYLGGAGSIMTSANAQLEVDQANARFGYYTASAGDVNGDGFDDVIVGATEFSNSHNNEGAIFVYHGSATGLSTTIATQIESNQAGAFLGQAVSSAGDINGDGYDDIIVGAFAYENGQTDEGAVFVYHGSNSGLNTTASTTIETNQVSAGINSVADAGDVNGDGYDDVIIGSWQYTNDQTNEGAAFVYHGSPDGLNTSTFTQLEADQTDAKYGFDVSTAGDVNGDGFADVMVAAYKYDNGQTDEGLAYIYHGSATGVNTTPATTIEGNQSSGLFAVRLDGGGDVNGDGFDDIIIGAADYTNGQTDEGVAFIYHGSNSGIGTSYATLLEQNQASSRFGYYVSMLGDINGDGFDDVGVGAHDYTNGQTNEGAVFIYHGSLSGVSPTAKGQFEQNQASALFGFSVAEGGDINGDGFADLITSARDFTNGESGEGVVFAYLGNSAGRIRHIEQKNIHSELVNSGGFSQHHNQFSVTMTINSPRGRERVKLQIETCPQGTEFGNGSCITTTTASWTDTGTNGTITLSETVTGLSANSAYRWRARALYQPFTITQPNITVPTNPRFGPWLRNDAISTAYDIKTSIQPTITSATYDATTAVLTATGVNFWAKSGSNNDVDISTLTFTGEGGNTYTLTSASDVEITNSTSFSLTLSASDKLAVNGLLNTNGTSADDSTSYNLAASDDFIAELSANNTADGVATISVSNVPTPTITSATYDYSTGVLAVTGSNFSTLSGSNNDIDVTKFTITGQGNGTRVLTTNNVDITSDSTFSVTLNAADKTAVNALLNTIGTQSADSVTYNLSAAEDWLLAGAASALIVDTTNGITVSNVATPTITSATFDYNTATLVVTGENFVPKTGANNDVKVTKLQITGESNSSYTLSASDVEIDSPTQFSITFLAAEQATVRGLLNKNGSSSNSGSTTFSLSASDDFISQVTSGDTSDSGNSITVNNYVIPTITSATYDQSTARLQVSGTNFAAMPGSNNDIDVSMLTITGFGNDAYTLTTSDVDVSGATYFNVDLNSADKANINGLLNQDGTQASDSSIYNIAGAEDWMLSGTTAENIVDLTANSITLSNYAFPANTSAIYNHGTGNLVVTGSGFAAKLGSANDVSANKLTITGSNGDTHTLTTSDVELDSDTQYTITLNTADKQVVNGLLNKAGNSSDTTVTTYNLAAADDFIAQVTNGNTLDATTSISVTNIQAPSITSASYDGQTGILTVTGSHLVKFTGTNNDVDITKLTLTGQENRSRILTTNNVEISSETAFSVTLNSADKTAVDLLLNTDGSQSADGVTYNLAAADDWLVGAGQSAAIDDLTANGVSVSNAPAPAITTATYNHATATLVVTGSDFIAKSGSNNDVDVSKLTIKGENNTTYTLTTNDIDIDSTSQFTLVLNAADKLIVNGLLNKNGTSSDTIGTTYNLASGDDFIPQVTAGDSADSTNTITVSNYTTPTITSATYNADTGILAVEGTALVGKPTNNDDVDVSKLTITGLGNGTYTLTTANVDVASETAFNINLNSADKSAVDALLNLNGTSASDSVVYNLGGAEDWMIAAGASATIADVTANPVTVSNAPMVISSASYNYGTGALVVSGLNFVALAGADNDVVASKLTLTGQGGGTHTLTTGDVELDSVTQFTLNLSGYEKAQVANLLNQAGTSADDTTSFNLAGADDYIGAVTTGDTSDSTNAITVSNFVSPSLSSVTYDYSTGTLTLTGSHFATKTGALNDIDVTKLTILGQGNTSRMLSSDNVEINSDGITIAISLNAADMLVVNGLLNKGGTTSDDNSTYNLALADNWLGGVAPSADIASSTNAITVSNVTAPTIVSATYNADTASLDVTGTGFVSKSGSNNDIDPTKLSLTGEGGNSYTLTNSGVDVTSQSAFSISLSESDKININGLLNKDGSSADDATSYNLAAFDNWLTGALSATDISDLTAPVTVSNTQIPTITSLTYDAATGVLTVTGSNLVKKFGANNDVDISQFTLTGENGQTYTLTSTSDIEITSSTSFTITLSGADLAAINGLFNANGTTSADSTSYSLAAADNWMAGAAASANIADSTSNTITVSNVPTPSITSASYDATTGILTVMGEHFYAKTGADNDVQVGKLSVTGQGGNSYTLTANDVELTSSNEFSVTLPAIDKLNINSLLHLNGTASQDGTAYNLAANDDFIADRLTADSSDTTGNLITVSNLINPTIISATYDMSTGQLVVSADNLLLANGANNDVDASLLTIKGEDDDNYTLTDTLDVELTDSTTFTLTLSATDKLIIDGLLNKNGTTSDNSTTLYNLAVADNWLAGAADSVDISDPTGNGITVSNISLPTISSASYNGTSGILSVTGTNFRKKIAANNDVVISQLSLTGQGNNSYTLTTADVELTSATSFSVTLNDTDIAELAVLLNKDGPSAVDGTIYNLGAADNWLNAAAPSEDISDSSDNAVTLSSSVEPRVTLTASHSSISENAGNTVLSATLSNATTTDITVSIAYTGTATSGSDYTGAANITILTGQTSGSVTLIALNDSLYDGTSNETIIADISAVSTGASESGNQQQTITIIDDETPPNVTLASSLSSMVETNGTATISANLDNASYEDVTVTLDFSGTGVANSDYTISNATIVISAGQTTGTATLTTLADTTPEASETIIVDIASITGGSAIEAGVQQQTITITDDDRVNVTLTASSNEMAENAGSVTLSANLSQTTFEDVMVTLAYSGSAVAGTDHIIPADTIVINAGQSLGSITLAVIDDSIDGPDVTIIASIATLSGGNATFNSPQSVSVAIINDDDLSAPTGYSVNINLPVINLQNMSNIAFNLENAEIGTTFNYTVSDIQSASTATRKSINRVTNKAVISQSGQVTSSNQIIDNIDVSALVDGPLTFSLTLTDASGNIGSPASATIEKDTSQSTVTLTPKVSSPVNQAFELLVTFDQEVSGLSLSDFDLTNATSSNLQGQGREYSLQITPITQGDLSIDLPAASAVNLAGNGNFKAQTLNLVYDAIAPQIASLSPANQSEDVAINSNLVIEFNEAVSPTANGLIEVRMASNDEIIQSISSSSGINIANNLVAIALVQNLQSQVSYYVTLSNDAFTDTAGNAFAGITDKNRWTFTAINTTPITLADDANVDEDSQVFIEVLANDSSQTSSLNPASVTLITDAQNGDTSINTQNGVITYIPDLNFNGSDSFSYQVTDFEGVTSGATYVAITVHPINDAPVAQNDTSETPEDNSVTIDVLANDSDADQGINGPNQIDSSTLVVVQNATNGDAKVVEGKINYLPANDFFGTDSFSYVVSDNTNTSSNMATVTINVVGSNDAPITTADSIDSNEDNSIDIAVLNNDNDIDGQIDNQSVRLITKPNNGEAQILAGGLVRYTPKRDYFGIDNITYTVMDDGGATSAQTPVIINVLPVNDAPIANNDLVSVPMNVTFNINVLGNDKDIDGTIVDLAIITQPNAGSVQVDSDNLQILYTPSADFSGVDALTYIAIDEQGLPSAPATVDLVVTYVNQAPIIVDDNITLDEDTLTTISVLTNDSDPDGNLLIDTLIIKTPPEFGSADVNENGEIIYQPNQNINGQDTLWYQIRDNNGAVGEAKVTITINPINDAPIAENLNHQSLNGESVEISLQGHDIDSDNLTYSHSMPTIGSLTGTPPEVIYHPEAGFNGPVSFTYTVSDELTTSQPGQVTIGVGVFNSAPVAQPQSLETNEDNQITITLNANDIDNDNLTYHLVSDVSNGTLAGSEAGGDASSGKVLTYTPTQDFNGIDTFTFIANDGKLNSNIASVDIHVSPIDDAPQAFGQNLEVNEDQQITITLTGYDGDNDTLSFNIVENVQNGELAQTGSSDEYIYRPFVNYHGQDSFTFTLSDGVFISPPATISLNVINQNDAPIAYAASISTIEDSSTSFTPIGDDIDADPLTFLIKRPPSLGQIVGSGQNWQYIPNDNTNGSDSFTYVANDGLSDSLPVTVNVEIISVNDTPIAIDDELITDHYQQLTLQPLTNDSDADGDRLIIIGATTDKGELSFDEQQIYFTPVSGYVGSALINYTIADINNRTGERQGTTSEAIITINVDPPLLDKPTIVVPPDVELNAQGLLTRVDLGTAEAFDSLGNPLAVTLVDGTRTFKSGLHTVFYRAIDNQGNQTLASQKVKIHPLASIKPVQTVQEGYSASASLQLSGPAPSYPVVVDYEVSGSAEIGLDHNLSSGSLLITSGSEAQLDFDIFNDDVIDDGENIIITLVPGQTGGLQGAQNINPNANRQLINIQESTLRPSVELIASQANQQRFIVNQEEGTIVINANVSHPQRDRQFDYRWIVNDQAIEQAKIDINENEQSYRFDPTQLSPGVYRIAVVVSDSTQQQLTAYTQLYFALLPNKVDVSDFDSDGDGIPDNVEGLNDSDGDGIPDYLDSIKQCNVVPEHGNNESEYLVEGATGGCLRLGASALASGSMVIETTQATDDVATNVGGLFDFEIYNLPEAGQSYQIVMPQLKPIPANAIYRKYKNGLWDDFVIGQGDELFSALGSAGNCPPPGSDNWQQGLNEGHWCVQVQITDGGPNDDDGIANGAIIDPGGIGVALGNNQQPQAQNDQAQTRVNTPLSIDALANDNDPDGDNLFIDATTVTLGTAQVIANQIHYQPPANYFGQDSIVYGINDGSSGSAIATITIDILANQFPVAMNDSFETQSTELITIDVLNNDYDPENDPLTLIAASSSNSTISINADSSLNYQSNPGFEGIDTITYRISDALGGEAIGEVMVTVKKQPLVTAPVSDNPQSSSGGGGSLSWGLLLFLMMLLYLQGDVQKQGAVSWRIRVNSPNIE